MQKIKFIMDSTCDLSCELIQRYNIVEVVPLDISMGDRQFKDKDFNIRDIYSFVKDTKKLPKTSAVNEFDFAEAYKRHTADGSAVLCFTISAELSSTHAAAVSAAKQFSDVYVVDARQLSSGTSLLMMRGADMIESNPALTAKELADTLNTMGGKVQSSFVVDTIDYLYKGGRCSALSLLGANLLKIHPSLNLKEGFITVGKKYRGRMTRVLSNYIKDLRAAYPDYDNTRCFITHTVDTPQAVIEEAKRSVAEHFDFAETHITNAGATITCHCGKGTLGLLFMRK